jgi:hypothetical protein
MLKYSVFLLLLVLATLRVDSVAFTFHANNDKRKDIAPIKKIKFDVKKASIGGILLGVSEKDVIKKLGLPKSRKTGYSPCGESKYITLTYNGINIELDGISETNKFYVNSITTSSSRYPTDTGIRTGDLMSKARKIYLPATSNDGQRGDEFYFSDPKYNWSGINFKGEKGTVKSISIGVDRC